MVYGKEEVEEVLDKKHKKVKRDSLSLQMEKTGFKVDDSQST
jgi:hypothetical protein